MSTADLTPLMRQYHEIKQSYPDMILLFQVGDFYELFFEDAKIAAVILGIALTKRGKINGQPIPLCGVPVHALDHYLAKLIKAGYKVAICDQLEEAKPGKVVRRGVSQVLTPGTLTDSKLLDTKSASYLLSFFPASDSYGLIFGELLTAQLFATVIPSLEQKSIESELIRFFPDEIILMDSQPSRPFQTYFKQHGYCITLVQNIDQEKCNAWIQNQFCTQTQMLLHQNPALEQAVATFHSFLAHANEAALSQFKTMNWYHPDDFLLMDRSTQINLELIRNTHDGTRKNSLLDVLDNAATPMGSRIIKKWIMRPLVKKQAIEQRFDMIQQLLDNLALMQELERSMHELADVERVVGRIAIRRATLNDYLHLKRTLQEVPSLLRLLQNIGNTLLANLLVEQHSVYQELWHLLDSALNDDMSKEWIIKSGFNERLDTLRDLAHNGTQKILALERIEQEKTGIASLKIRYNQIHGYYIEVTKTHSDAIPDRYIRQQTLVGKERYITVELQQLQHEILNAQNSVIQEEKLLFETIKQQVFNQINALRKLAHTLANLDAIIGLARTAYHNRYIRPMLHQTRDILIKGGRHPVVEQSIGHSFIPNDTSLNDQQSTLIITGPNMGGKSTYLRQIPLITIMAQIGSFVPAQEAQLPILDRIFTRIGSGDNLASGKSTFLVEMEETASICANATAASLVILDEVGRGTSTFDGLAIAQAVVEYIHTHIKARCLFATHYQELTLLPNNYPEIACFHAASKKHANGIQFLYKIVPGIAHGSFGIEVAKLAELPASIIARAHTLLNQFEYQQPNQSKLNLIDSDHMQYLQEKIELLERKFQSFKAIDYENLSPKAAFDFLWKFHQEIEQ